MILREIQAGMPLLAFFLWLYCMSSCPAGTRAPLLCLSNTFNRPPSHRQGCSIQILLTRPGKRGGGRHTWKPALDLVDSAGKSLRRSRQNAYMTATRPHDQSRHIKDSVRDLTSVSGVSSPSTGPQLNEEPRFPLACVNLLSSPLLTLGLSSTG